MSKRILALAAITACLGASAIPAQAQNEQFIPQLVYRTGPFSPNGVPLANGILDYYTLINERDGGINGVKILVEECEFGYLTDRGVECYERLKAKGPTGAAFFHPFSTGVTFALTEKTTTDKIPLLTIGYGRADSQNGGVFQWNFPLMGTYWSSGDVAIQHIAKKEGGFDKLKGKKITLVYHDSAAGKESIPVLQKRAAMHGFEFNVLPVTAPGIEQKATWLQIRQAKPDWILLWGWGVMNSTAIKEAVAVGFPRDKMLGWWWSGAEPDVKPAADDAKGYSSLAMQHSAGRFKLHEDLKKHVFDKGKTQGKWEDAGDVLYNRGLITAMLGIEGIRKAQEKYGKKPLKGEEVRWGLENLEINEARVKELGFEGVISGIKLSCSDHEGTSRARVHTWDGTAWKISSDWYEGDKSIVAPLVKENSAKYAEEKKIVPVADCK
jgi:branched-chain amino acid transport system substrate-binding protein